MLGKRYSVRLFVFCTKQVPNTNNKLNTRFIPFLSMYVSKPYSGHSDPFTLALIPSPQLLNGIDSGLVMGIDFDLVVVVTHHGQDGVVHLKGYDKAYWIAC
jgi:hypothetical protein